MVKPLTLAETAEFLRMSRSSLYQRKEIPRYRRPGSRIMLFDQDELETWLKKGRIGDPSETSRELPETKRLNQAVDTSGKVVEISKPRVYHRNALYR